MAKLILSLDNAVIRELPLDRERLTIGRKAHNDLQIDNLAVSGEHALVVTILDDSFLEDLGSTNGTLVNGNPVKKHILQDNDVIEIGKYRLKYVNEAPVSQASVSNFERNMVLRTTPGGAATQSASGFGDTQVSMAASVAPAGRAADGALDKLAAIQILSGPSAGKELELVKNLTTLGKPGVQVAVITRRPHGYFIAHVEGENYPIVNGKVLDIQPHQLKDHDVLELAGVKMEFFFKNA